MVMVTASRVIASVASGCPNAPPPNALDPACVRVQVLVGSATSGLLASEAAGSWSPVAVKLSAEGDYDRFGR